MNMESNVDWIETWIVRIVVVFKVRPSGKISNNLSKSNLPSNFDDH